MMMGNRVSSLWREAVKGTFALIFKHMRVIYFQHQGRACGPEEKKKGQDDRRGKGEKKCGGPDRFSVSWSGSLKLICSDRKRHFPDSASLCGSESI